MENKEYESPKITVISLEPDASLMEDTDTTSLPRAGTNLGSFDGDLI